MTRMWAINPRWMCREHLLGEHKEMHQIVGHIQSGNISVVEGHADKGQMETGLIQERHDMLAEEMLRRHFTHDSPMEYEDDLDLGRVRPNQNLRELAQRCDACRQRMKEEQVIVE